MKKAKLIGFLLVAAVAQACGTRGDPEAGTDFRVDSITSESTDVNTTCQRDTARMMQKDGASAELESKPTSEDAPSIDVVVSDYDIEYEPLDGGPELSGHSYPLQQTVLVPGNGKSTFSVEMLPINTKKQYYNATTGTTSFNRISFYTAHYVFRGTTEYEVPVEATGEITFALGNNYIVDCK